MGQGFVQLIKHYQRITTCLDIGLLDGIQCQQGLSFATPLGTPPALSPLDNNDCELPAGNGLMSQCVHTHEIQVGSAAIKAGSNPMMLNFDQRGSGFSRSVGIVEDRGAIEIDPDQLFRDGFEPYASLQPIANKKAATFFTC